MYDQILNVSKAALLCLLYLFFARVLWSAWSEVRAPSTIQLWEYKLKRNGRVGFRKLNTLKSPTRLMQVEPTTMRGKSIPLSREIRVGRGFSNHLVWPDDGFISVNHARFFEMGGIWFVEDLQSTNGTFVNAEKIAKPHALRVDDRVQFGSNVLEVQ